MRTAKNILLFVFILIISLNVTVHAQENGEKTENPVKVTQESENDKDVPFTNSKRRDSIYIVCNYKGQRRCDHDAERPYFMSYFGDG